MKHKIVYRDDQDIYAVTIDGTPISDLSIHYKKELLKEIINTINNDYINLILINIIKEFGKGYYVKKKNSEEEEYIYMLKIQY